MSKSKTPNKQETSIFLKCDCGCAMLVFEKTIWDDSEVAYNIMVQDSRYDHNHTTLFGRIKSAFKILLGKPVCYNDVYIGDPEKFKEFVGQLNELCEDGRITYESLHYNHRTTHEY